MQVDPTTDDDEMVTWWGLVIEGYAATQDRLMGEIFDRHGLAPAQFDILVRLLRSPDHRQPMTKLAAEAALSSGGFTKVADRMVKADLIRREPCATDRRVVFATLTENGLATATRARRTCAAVLRRIVLEPLGQDRAGELAESMRGLRETNRIRREGRPD
ncbi:MAG: MarR family transcriptional regulator [Nocardia sp.]|nr:MarR family transcriptional regulator [Nocardia sp.]